MKAKLFSSLLGFYLITTAATIAVISQRNSVVLAQPQNAQKQQADGYLTKAQGELERGSLLSAKGNFQRALQIYQTIQDTTGQKDSLVGLAKIDYQEARYTEALFNLRKAERYNSGERDGQLLTTKGLIYLELGDYHQATQDLRIGVHYLQVSGNRDRSIQREIQQARIALGEAYLYLGQYQPALTTLQSELNSTADSHLRRRVFNIMGITQLELAQYEEALASFEQALRVANIPGDRVGKAKTLENLGRAYHALGDRRKALKYYQQALGQLQSMGAWGQQVFVLNRLGVLAGDLGLNNRALEYLQQAEGTLSSSGGAGRVITLINLGNYYSRQGDLEAATEYLTEAFNWARSNGDRIGETKALSSLGAIQLQSGKINEAIASLENSIEVFESLSPGLRDRAKISLFDTQVRTYSLLQRAYITQQQPNEALIVAERGRARAFIELLARRLSDKPHQDSIIAAPTIEEIKQVASDRNSTLITYSIITDDTDRESQLYMWVINPAGNIEFRQLDLTLLRNEYDISVANVSESTNQTAGGGVDSEQPVIENLENLIVAMRGDPTELSNQSDRKRVSTLNGYKILIEPIADLLPTNPEDKIIFIPQGMLFLVPFAALQNADGNYLIQQHTIQIAPSIQTLTLNQSQANSQTIDSSQALIIGNPEPMPEDLFPLPGTEEEAKTIAQLLDVNPILKTAATETAIKEQITQAATIHFATHGLYNDVQGLQSSLALSTIDGDGFLTAEEILDLDLQAELVVLSACNTGRGKITGDGVVGLSRSFLAAGAQSAIASLWYVPDLSTATLMIEFYQNLEQTNDKAQALRQAMLTVMEQHPHPLNWASFFLVEQ
ncbi:TPR repeat-containing protein [Hyella patelloides LEGE 07179]|uniref:TPR repeat-containing protein n=1 Tax=Hyella patelloides LEGE 07179 TaxID=945734 RepID=A0A563W1K7_9CYAN|nr:CHAT domain-containing protein [Hyella patelloides]VEP17578.1 TPR repeat-containing protein [Hyella patelloides LEGE 07179]